MIFRIWRTQIMPGRKAEFEHFANTRSLPMFKQQQGFLGVVFMHTEKDSVTLSIWEDKQAVEALTASETYQATVKDILASGLLMGEQTTEVFEVFGGEALPAFLDRLTR